MTLINNKCPGWVKNPFQIFLISLWLCGPLFFIFPVGANAGEDAVLKYTYRPDQNEVVLLKDIKGNVYLPLQDVAQFYGIQLNFDSQTRRVTLGKGKSQIKTVLSQPVFLTGDPISAFPMEPAEVVSGQLGIPPEAAVDILMAILNVLARWEPEQQALVVGGIPRDEIRDEILAQGKEKDTVAVSTAVPETTAQEKVSNAVQKAESTPSGGGENGEKAVESAAPAVVPRKVEEEAPPSNQAFHVRRIIIDPGHGGRDIGASGFDRNYFEKQATLEIARRVAELLKKDPKLEVLMTRTADYYVSLRGRTDFANRHKADLFVSIHCNSNRHSRATGTETYVYGLKASNNFAAGAARRENGRRDYTGSLLNDLHQRIYVRRSYDLADKVEEQIKKG